MSAANPSSTPHKKTFGGFQRHSPALPGTPPHSGLDKLPQYGSTHSQAHTLSSLWPLCLSHSVKSALNWRRSGGSCAPPPPPPPTFSFSLIHSPRLRPPWGPPEGLCADRWPVVSLEAGLHRVQPLLLMLRPNQIFMKMFELHQSGSSMIEGRCVEPTLLATDVPLLIS